VKGVACTSIQSDVIDSGLYLGYDVIGIDEAQFFPDIVQGCETLAKTGLTLIVAGLDGTFQRQPFGSLLNLIPLCEKVKKLSAICMGCKRTAGFTSRIDGGRNPEEVEVIGGVELYKPVCRECYY
jgi:thymidine kinase